MRYNILTDATKSLCLFLSNCSNALTLHPGYLSVLNGPKIARVWNWPGFIHCKFFCGSSIAEQNQPITRLQVEWLRGACVRHMAYTGSRGKKCRVKSVLTLAYVGSTSTRCTDPYMCINDIYICNCMRACTEEPVCVPICTLISSLCKSTRLFRNTPVCMYDCAICTNNTLQTDCTFV